MDVHVLWMSSVRHTVQHRNRNRICVFEESVLTTSFITMSSDQWLDQSVLTSGLISSVLTSSLISPFWRLAWSVSSDHWLDQSALTTGFITVSSDHWLDQSVLTCGAGLIITVNSDQWSYWKYICQGSWLLQELWSFLQELWSFQSCVLFLIGIFWCCFVSTQCHKLMVDGNVMTCQIVFVWRANPLSWYSCSFYVLKQIPGLDVEVWWKWRGCVSVWCLW